MQATKTPSARIRRPALDELERAFDDIVAGASGATVVIAGETGSGKTALVDDFVAGCDARHERNVLTATGRCTDFDGLSRGYLPWQEVLLELDADRAAGRDQQSKRELKQILRTVFEETGPEWIQSVPQIGEISSAIIETAQAIRRTEQIDTVTGETRQLGFRDRLERVTRQCAGAWLGAIPVVGGVAEAIYKTSVTLAENRQSVTMQHQEDFFALVLNRLRELAREHPIVVVLEDLQWVDASSLGLFSFIARSLQQHPFGMLLIGTYRPEDVRRGRIDPTSGSLGSHPLEERLATMERYGAFRELPLRPFSTQEVAAIVAARFPNHRFPRSFIASLARETAGNPLFIGELLTMMVERGVIAERDSRWALVGTVDYSTLPKSIEGVVRERYVRLDEDLREIVQIAALHGEWFSLQVVADVMGEDVTRIHRSVNRLIERHGLVRRSNVVHDTLSRIYEFEHAIVQKFIYNLIDPDLRVDLHKTIAGALDRILGNEELKGLRGQYLYHLGVGNRIIDEQRRPLFLERTDLNLDAARRYLVLRASEANDYAYSLNGEEALVAIDESTRLAIRLEESATEIQMLLLRGSVLDVLGRWEEAEATYTEALGRAQDVGDRQRESDARNGVGLMRFRLGDYDVALENFRQRVAAAEEMGDMIGAYRAVGSCGNVHFRRGKFDEALSCYGRALEIAEEVQYDPGIAAASGGVAIVALTLGNYDLAMEHLMRQRDISERVGDLQGVAHASINMGTVHFERCEFAEANAVYEVALESAAELGDRQSESTAIVNIGLVLRELGEYEEAADRFEQARALCDRLGDRHGFALATGYLGTVLLAQGELQPAAELFEHQLNISGELEDANGIAEARLNRASVRRASGDGAGAAEDYREALAGFESIGLDVGRARAMAGIASTMVDAIEADEGLPEYILNGDVDRGAGWKDHASTRALEIALESVELAGEGRGTEVAHETTVALIRALRAVGNTEDADAWLTSLRSESYNPTRKREADRLGQ